MKTNLLELSEMETDEKELIPEIFPIDARLSISGSVSALFSLFSSAAEVAPVKEVISYTSFSLLEAFDASGNTLSYVQVSATDGERSIAVLDDSLTVNMAGEALLPGRRIMEILKLAPENVVRLDVVGATATIRSGQAVWTVATPPTDATIPDFAETADIKLYSLLSADLASAFQYIYPAVSKSTARQALMQAEIDKGAITACDGVRAHRVKIEGLPKEFKTTIPLRFIESALRELRHAGEYVQIGSNSNTVVIHFGKNILMTQRLNFEYPAVNHLVLEPALQNEESLVIPVKRLIETVKRVRINADPDFSALYLAIRKVKDSWALTVRARDKQGNASQESLPVEYTGPQLAKDLIVSHRYFLEFLSCLVEEEKVTLKLGESSKTKQAPIYVDSGDFVGSLSTMASNFIK